jgi:hypothetical protein
VEYHVVLKRLTNTDRSFYPTLGPFLSRRAIVKEIGGPIWDDDGKTWWAALAGREVAGFAAARDLGSHVVFQSAYTRAEYRRQGIYRALFYARMETFGGQAIRSVCTASSLPMFLSNGFTAVRNRGSFTEVTNAV